MLHTLPCKTCSTLHDLHELDVSRNELINCATRSLVKTIATTQLAVLRLGHCKLGATTVAQLCKALKKPNCLTELDLTDNAVGPHGAIALGGVLGSEHCTLEVLQLADNNISLAGCQSVAKGLERSRTLRALGLRGNDVGDAGGASIGHALLANRVLQNLDLQNNGICALAELADAVTANASLRRLNLKLNVLNAPAIKSLVAALRQNHTCRFNLMGCTDRSTDAHDVMLMLKFSGINDRQDWTSQDKAAMKAGKARKSADTAVAVASNLKSQA